MHIWLVEFKAIFHKAKFSYLFVKTFFWIKQDKYGLKTIVLINLFKTSSFTSEVGMLGASVVFLDQLLKLSVTGDTAKYLVLNSVEIVHFHH